MRLKSIVIESNLIRYARNVGSEHFSTSAKSGAGVADIFKILGESMLPLKVYNA
jgi:hypothetical protein